jgi:hypothetical protein
MVKKRGIYISALVVAILVAVGCTILFDSEENTDISEKEGESMSGEKESTEEGGCDADSDCVPNGCCHSTKCVEKAKAPKCERVFCTMECEEGTLDCGQGECKCLNGRCSAVINDG